MTKYTETLADVEITDCLECGMEELDCDCKVDWTVANVSKLPNCNYCDKTAGYDAEMKYAATGHNSVWAFLCETHFYEKTNGVLGCGKGQRLVVVAAGN